MEDIIALRKILDDIGKDPQDITKLKLKSFLYYNSVKRSTPPSPPSPPRLSFTERLMKACTSLFDAIFHPYSHLCVCSVSAIALPEFDSDKYNSLMKMIVDVTLSYNSPQKADVVLGILSEVNDNCKGEYCLEIADLRAGLKNMNARALEVKRHEIAIKENDTATLSAFAQTVIVPGKAEEVIRKLHELMDGREKPKDALMPIRAAMDAAAIRRPTWPEFCQEFGEARISSKGLLSKYTNENYVYMGDDYERLKAIFLDII